MTGIEFKELDIESKVKYINELLAMGDSVDNIRNDLEIGKNYIANEFKKYSYKLDRNLNQYVNTKSIATNVAQVITKPIEKPKSIDNTNTNDTKYKALEGQISDLQNQINMINNRLDNAIATNVVTVDTSIINKDIDSSSNTDTVNRNYRLYKDIHNEFTMFCKSHKQYKVQDIISSAIKDYLDKHNN